MFQQNFVATFIPVPGDDRRAGLKIQARPIEKSVFLHRKPLFSILSPEAAKKFVPQRNAKSCPKRRKSWPTKIYFRP
jgi:hypothetical protein